MLLIKFMIQLVYITVLKKFPIRREPASSWDHYNRSDWIKVTPLQNEKCLFYLYRQNGPPTIFFFFPRSLWHVDWLWLIAVSSKVPFTSIGTGNKIIQTIYSFCRFQLHGPVIHSTTLVLLLRVFFLSKHSRTYPMLPRTYQ